MSSISLCYITNHGIIALALLIFQELQELLDYYARNFHSLEALLGSCPKTSYGWSTWQKFHSLPLLDRQSTWVDNDFTATRLTRIFHSWRFWSLLDKTKTWDYRTRLSRRNLRKVEFLSRQDLVRYKDLLRECWRFLETARELIL